MPDTPNPHEERERAEAEAWQAAHDELPGNAERPSLILTVRRYKWVIIGAVLAAAAIWFLT